MNIKTKNLTSFNILFTAFILLLYITYWLLIHSGWRGVILFIVYFPFLCIFFAAILTKALKPSVKIK